MRAAAALVVAGALAAGAASAAGGPAPRPLGELARAADAVVLGRVERTVRWDSEGLRLHRLRALRVLHGRLRDPDVLEIRHGSTGIPALAVGRRVIVLLRDGPPLTQFDEDLPRIPCFVTVSGPDGVIAVDSDADVEAAETAIRPRRNRR